MHQTCSFAPIRFHDITVTAGIAIHSNRLMEPHNKSTRCGSLDDVTPQTFIQLIFATIAMATAECPMTVFPAKIPPYRSLYSRV